MYAHRDMPNATLAQCIHRPVQQSQNCHKLVKTALSSHMFQTYIHATYTIQQLIKITSKFCYGAYDMHNFTYTRKINV